MLYRPQFVFPDPPPGCRYESFVYCYDESNTPALSGLNLASGQTVLHIPLHLDQDADFLWLGTKLDVSPLGVQFQIPWTEPLSDDFVAAVLFADNVQPTPLEAPVMCPAGSIISLSLKNLA